MKRPFQSSTSTSWPAAVVALLARPRMALAVTAVAARPSTPDWMSAFRAMAAEQTEAHLQRVIAAAPSGAAA